MMSANQQVRKDVSLFSALCLIYVFVMTMIPPIPPIPAFVPVPMPRRSSTLLLSLRPVSLILFPLFLFQGNIGLVE